ncbi:MAG: type II toxin-antitoxin system Phd/YefM family antitoxin [Nostoc sp. NMS1]|uniref:type II toxin-antitoxin system Phd/YefM family antitoxin n=1 Tax=unclassified Nostoc TaxID=2593658 RepID=UPI0025F2390D|nr:MULTISPECIES: type II toxin-antitoxin system Phd/YefM family antitoxin [unclassified Nostoc]MBN3909757.1 type II toxin-antitoxin system Phd/YefM family antitoxin [Nostoc sp. NMS1]MBN3994914.1 type II toxin-antitoxin system Phd/YefM family antitoxin [Nostoc sp. NMS2]
MTQITIEEATKNLYKLLEKVAKGEQFVLMKEGKEVARLLPPQQEKKVFPNLNYFRKSIVLKGSEMSTTILEERDNQRY